MNRPENNRLIRLYGYDWSPFECVGMWVPYKKPKPGKKVAGARFMMRDSLGNFNAAMDTWRDGERWEYIDEEKP